jgi:hypothetical protein
MHHRVKVGSQCLAVSRLQLLDQILHVFAYKLLC